MWAVVTLPDVPGKSVTVGDTEVYVHPISHTHDTLPLLRPGDEMKEYIQESVAEYTENGADVYMEQNLPSDYDLEDQHVQEIDDHRWAEEQYSRIWEEGEQSRKKEQYKMLAYALSAPIRAPLIWGRLWKEELFGVDEETQERREKLKKDAEYLTDPDALDEYETTTREESPPEPELRDRLWEENPVKAVVRSERSRYIAKYVVEHTDDDTDEAHVFVGGGHYTGVLHWLQEYKDGTKMRMEDAPDAHKLAEGYLQLDDE